MILSTPLPPTEGIGHYCTQLAHELVRQGHAVTLITRGRAHSKSAQHPDGFKILWVPFVPLYPFHIHAHGVFLQRVVRELESSTDIFHVHSPLVPMIRTCRPVITTVHSPMRHDGTRSEVTNVHSLLSALQTPFSVAAERQVFQRSVRVTAVSKWVADYVREYYGLRDSPIAIVGNGYDPAMLQDNLSPGPGREPGLVLYVGRLAHGKGLIDLVRAFALVSMSMPTARLRIVGDGPLRRRLLSEIARHQLGAVVSLHGPISVNARDELARLYGSASAFVLPSHHEGLPTTILEAMAAGTPVITTATTGCAELVEDGVTGLIVPVGDPERLASSILSILQSNKLAAELAYSAKHFVREQFSWKRVTQRFTELYGQASR